MADAIQKLKNSMNRGITTISVKTSSSLEKSKINMHIESLEKEIQALFQSIGTEAYALWESENPDFLSLTEKFDAVKQKKEEIEKLSAELELITQRDNQILGTAAGNTSEPAQAPGVITCPQCGAFYDTPVKFCRKCGCNLQNN